MSIPENTILYQNYPNPFNPKTRIRFNLPKDDHVKIIIYNTLGQLIYVLTDNYYTAGNHSLIWDGCEKNDKKANSGIYYYRIESGKIIEIKKMILVK